MHITRELVAQHSFSHPPTIPVVVWDGVLNLRTAFQVVTFMQAKSTQNMQGPYLLYKEENDKQRQ